MPIRPGNKIEIRMSSLITKFALIRWRAQEKKKKNRKRESLASNFTGAGYEKGYKGSDEITAKIS